MEMGDYLMAVQLGTGFVPSEVFGGQSTTCFTTAIGAVKCWGSNGFGQLGLGDTAARGDGGNEMGDYLPQLSLGTGLSVIDLGLGFTHTCGVMNSFQIKCWGESNMGQLGYEDTTNRGDGPSELGDYLPLVNLPAGRNAVSIYTGFMVTVS